MICMWTGSDGAVEWTW